ncbi:MAG: hypothetical protein ACSLE3_15640 [Microbacteriaceae bacterium]
MPANHEEERWVAHRREGWRVESSERRAPVSVHDDSDDARAAQGGDPTAKPSNPAAASSEADHEKRRVADMPTATPARPTTDPVRQATVNAGFSHTLTSTKDALVSEGMQVISQVDIRGAVEADCSTSMNPYVVLGAYIPDVVVATVDRESGAALFAMYTVVVRSQGEHTTVVETYNPASFAPAGDDDVRRAVAAAGERLEAAIAKLESGAYDKPP